MLLFGHMGLLVENHLYLIFSHFATTLRLFTGLLRPFTFSEAILRLYNPVIHKMGSDISNGSAYPPKQKLGDKDRINKNKPKIENRISKLGGGTLSSSAVAPLVGQGKSLSPGEGPKIGETGETK